MSKGFKKLPFSWRNTVMKQLKGISLSVWMYHYWRSNKNDVADITIAELVASLPYSEDRIMRSRTNLRKLGFLTIVSYRDSEGRFDVPIHVCSVPDKNKNPRIVEHEGVQNVQSECPKSTVRPSVQNVQPPTVQNADPTNCTEYVEGFSEAAHVDEFPVEVKAVSQSGSQADAGQPSDFSEPLQEQRGTTVCLKEEEKVKFELALAPLAQVGFSVLEADKQELMPLFLSDREFKLKMLWLAVVSEKWQQRCKLSASGVAPRWKGISHSFSAWYSKALSKEGSDYYEIQDYLDDLLNKKLTAKEEKAQQVAPSNTCSCNGGWCLDCFPILKLLKFEKGEWVLKDKGSVMYRWSNRENAFAILTTHQSVIAEINEVFCTDFQARIPAYVTGEIDMDKGDETVEFSKKFKIDDI